MNILDEAVLREALVHAEAAVTVFDASRRFVAANDRYLALTGYSREEVDAHQAGSTLRLPALEQDEFIELITSKISAGEADILLKNGEPMAVEYVVIPTSIGGVRHYIGMMWPLVYPTPVDEEALSKRGAP